MQISQSERSQLNAATMHTMDRIRNFEIPLIQAFSLEKLVKNIKQLNFFGPLYKADSKTEDEIAAEFIDNRRR